MKGAWSADEDELLLKAIEANGTRKWSVLASHLPGRTGKQCRERWHNQLNPDISKSPWTEAEDRIIIAERDDGVSRGARRRDRKKNNAGTPSSARGGRTSPRS